MEIQNTGTSSFFIIMSITLRLCTFAVNGFQQMVCACLRVFPLVLFEAVWENWPKDKKKPVKKLGLRKAFIFLLIICTLSHFKIKKAKYISPKYNVEMFLLTFQRCFGCLPTKVMLGKEPDEQIR